MEEEKRLEETLSVFEDIASFLSVEDELKEKTLFTLIRSHDLSAIFVEMKSVFSSHEMYEKCRTIEKWEKMMKNG